MLRLFLILILTSSPGCAMWCLKKQLDCLDAAGLPDKCRAEARQCMLGS